MKRLFLKNQTKGRPGFTLIELLVVISIIGVLIALVSPAIQAARESARRLECLNNIRNIGLAIITRSTSDGKVPRLVDFIGQDGAGNDIARGWPAHLLGNLERPDLERDIAGGATPLSLQNFQVKVFTCPSDLNNFGVPQGLSFGANIGYIASNEWGVLATDADPVPPAVPVAGSSHNAGSIDWVLPAGVGPEDVPVHRATGVFWRRGSFIDPLDTTRATFGAISRGDGQTQTLLLIENANANDWDSIETGDLGVGVRISVTSGSRTPTLSGAADPEGNIGGGTFAPLLLLVDFDWDLSKPDEGLTTVGPGGASRASSFHPGVFNVCFSDGHAKGISKDISAFVYASLLTPAGTTRGQQILNEEF